MPLLSAAAREALQWGCRDALREHGELIESLGISIREAAFRGDDALTKMHVAQARLVVIDALDAIKKLNSVNLAKVETDDDSDRGRLQKSP